MIKPIQTESLKTLLLVVCLTLSLAACGDNEEKPPVPENIEKVYEEMLAKIIARQMAHTGDGPVFTEEEIAEFDRLEQQYNAYKKAKQKIARQQQLRANYQTCVDNQDTACPELVRYRTKMDRVDRRVMTLRIHDSLPENITYQYYFGLAGEGCESDGPVNQWTDVDTVTVRYAGKGEIITNMYNHMGLRQGQCHIEQQLKTPDIVFQSDKNPEELTFSYNVPPNIDDVIYACQDRNSRECRKFVKIEFNGAGEMVPGYGRTAFEVKINNTLPEDIAYQHHFSLADIDGCISDGPLDQWTDTNSIVVGYNGEDMVHQSRGDPSIDGECEVRVQLKIADADLVFKPMGGSHLVVGDDVPGIAKLKFSLKRGELIYWHRQ